jgi:hypothetical protein
MHQFSMAAGKEALFWLNKVYLFSGEHWIVVS